MKFVVGIVLDEDAELFLEEFGHFLKISCSGCIVHVPCAHRAALSARGRALLLHIHWIKEMLLAASLLIF